MSIAITGASGQLGRRVAELLLEQAAPSDVVLITRSPEALADLSARGAQVRPGDFAEPASLAAAFRGVDRLLLISTDAVGNRLDHQRAAISAARDAGVHRVAYTSIPQPTSANPALVVEDHRLTEKALRESGLAWTALRNSLYADMQALTVQRAIQSGQLVTNAGDGRAAYVAREDCAAAAVAVLTQDGHEDRAYDITGPQALSASDIAQLAGELGGTTVTVVNVDDQAIVDGFVRSGAPEFVGRLMASFGASIRENYLATVSSAVADLTGRSSRSLRDVLPPMTVHSPPPEE